MNEELEFFDHDVTANVNTLLTKYSKSKGDEVFLVATYYYTYYRNRATRSALDFIKAMAEGRLVSSDLITRTRRKLQEHNPELRGTKWKERHQKQTEVKSDLRKVEQFRNSI